MKLHFFKGCKDLNEVKKKYRDLCKEFHPDINPNVDIKVIQDLNAQYKYVQKYTVSYPIDTIVQTEYRKDFQYYKEDVDKYREQEKYNKEERAKIIFLNNKITEAFKKLKETDYKPIVLYFKFLEYINANNLKAEKSHFELIGRLLKYNQGWAYHKYNEYMENK